MSQLFETWQALDLRRRIVLAGAVILTIAAVLSLANIATRPGMSLLYSGLDPAAAGEVVGSLEQMGVVSEVRGDAIYVTEDARDRVRLALAREGLPRQGQAGYELLDQISGFSATSDMFDAAYWRAKEGELARTILASPGVRAARVHIAVPSRRPFARSGSGTTAAITVTMSGGALTPEQATALRYVVALAVADLSPDQVAVIDSRAGMVLAPGTNNPLTNASSRAHERETKLKAEIEQLLAARVGRDKARVSVTVETDREAETLTERVIKPDTRVTIHSDTEEITDDSQGANGNVTVASNLPDGDANAQNTRSSARTESRERVNYDYSEVRRETVRAAGAIRRISVAVLVDGIVAENAAGESSWQPRTPEELDTLRELVAAAVGFDESRGDVVTVESMPFQPDATPGALVESSPISRFIERNALTLVQLVVLAVVAIILALTVIRPMLNARPEPNAFDGMALAADGGAELQTLGAAEQGALPNPEGGSGSERESEEDAEFESDYLTTETSPIEALRAIVADRPEQALIALREWLEDEELSEEAA